MKNIFLTLCFLLFSVIVFAEENWNKLECQKQKEQEQAIKFDRNDLLKTQNLKISLLIEQELLIKYKALIKSANANIAVLLSIQKKYITRGYFDPSKVNAVDKKKYNINLNVLKAKAKKLDDIDRYEDKDDKAQDELTMSELGSLSNINDWNYNVYELN